MQCLGGKDLDWVCDDAGSFDVTGLECRGSASSWLAELEYLPSSEKKLIITGESILGSEGSEVSFSEREARRLSTNLIPHVDEKSKAEKRARELEDIRLLNLATSNSLNLVDSEAPVDVETFHERQKVLTKENRSYQRVALALLHSYRADDKWTLESICRKNSADSLSAISAAQYFKGEAWGGGHELEAIHGHMKSMSAIRAELIKRSMACFCEDTSEPSRSWEKGACSVLPESLHLSLDPDATMTASTSSEASFDKTSSSVMYSSSDATMTASTSSDASFDKTSSSVMNSSSELTGASIAEHGGDIIDSAKSSIETSIILSDCQPSHTTDSIDESNVSQSRNEATSELMEEECSEQQGNLEPKAERPLQEDAAVTFVDDADEVLVKRPRSPSMFATNKDSSSATSLLAASRRNHFMDATSMPRKKVDDSASNPVDTTKLSILKCAKKHLSALKKNGSSSDYETIQTTSKGHEGRGTLLRSLNNSNAEELLQEDLICVPLYHRPPIASRKTNLMPICSSKYIPNLHKAKDGCERCMHWATTEERNLFKSEGHHLRIMMVRGGCSRDCVIFPRNGEEHPVRLCKKCFFDTHRDKAFRAEEKELWKT